MIIESGTGNGNSAGVNTANRLLVSGVNVLLENARLFEGTAFNWSTGSITLTSANESGLLYIKSNAGAIAGIGTDLFIPSVSFWLGDSTGGTAEWHFRVYRNPTTGTLVSGGTDGTLVNLDYGSNREFDGDALVGAEGSTITNGTVGVQGVVPAASTGLVQVPVSFLLKQGNTLAVSLEPPTGNTSAVVQVQVQVFMVDLSNLT